MSSKLVSVILPTFNGKAKWLSGSIESVLTQTYTNIELIIINDGSHNNIEQLILDYSRKDSRIIYLKNENNMERAYSKNKGILNSKGEYIAFIDDDDYWSDELKIEKQITFLEANPTYGLCGSSMISIDDSGNKTIVKVRGSDCEIRKNILNRNQIAQSGVMIKKSILFHAGLFDTDYIPSEDYDLWLRIGRFSKMHNLNDTYFTYRNRMSNSSNKQRFRQEILSLSSMRKNKFHYTGFIKALFLRLGYLIIPKDIGSKFLYYKKINETNN